jgi:malate dehydrogenase (oxaloacetate-decarboxylating)(NADP+)
MLGAAVVRRFGLEPKIALLSHANFGSRGSDSSRKMHAALALVRERDPGLEVDGEMNADVALSQELRDRVLPASRLKGEANLLIMPDLDAAKIASQLVAAMDNSLPVGPILVGAAKPAQIVTSTTTARGLVNVTAYAAMEAQFSHS